MSINKEKVCELVDIVYDNIGSREEKLIKWLDQNQPEPMAIGLSDEQVLRYALSHSQNEVHAESIAMQFKAWQQTQTFAQPEVKEVAVGLSDEQVNKLSDFLSARVDQTWNRYTYKNELANWLKTKTFTQPVEFSNIKLADSYQSLCEDLEQLKKEHGLLEDAHAHLKVAYDEQTKYVQDFKNEYEVLQLAHSHDVEMLEKELKSQQFTPSWDDAPSWANWLAQDDDGQWYWYQHKPVIEESKHFSFFYSETGKKVNIKAKNWKQTLQQRPSKIQKAVEWGNARISSFSEYPKIETVAQEQKQFVVDWDNAPLRADEATITLNWYHNGIRIEGKHLFREERPQSPKPKPVVEVGQVWKNEFGKSEVIAVNAIQVVRKDIAGCFIVNDIEDFIARFERVS